MAQLKNTDATKLTLNGGSIDVETRLKNLETTLNGYKDYIIYQGTVTSSGIPWTVKKWNSGVVEVFGCYTFAPSKWDAWGSTYESESFGPFTFPSIAGFKEAPAFFTSVCGNQSSLGTDNSTPVSTTQTPTMYILRPTTGFASYVQVSMYAIGKYK